MSEIEKKYSNNEELIELSPVLSLFFQKMENFMRLWI